MIAKKNIKDPTFLTEYDQKLRDVLTLEYNAKMSEKLKNGQNKAKDYVLDQKDPGAGAGTPGGAGTVTQQAQHAARERRLYNIICKLTDPACGEKNN